MVTTPPWYRSLRHLVAPTEKTANLVLLSLIIASVIILWKGDAVVKGLWVVYLVSP